MKLLFSLGLLLSLAIPAAAQNAPDVLRGPVFSGTIRGPKSNDAIAMKGIVVTVGSGRNAWVCFDTDLMRVSMAWTGQFLVFGNTQTQIAWPPPPQVAGTPVFSTKESPGWAKGDSMADPRPNQQGPLPKDWAHYKGFYVNGDKVVLAYTVGTVEVLEMAGYESIGDGVFTRSFEIAPSSEPLTLSLCSVDAAPDRDNKIPLFEAGSARFTIAGREQKLAVGLIGAAPSIAFNYGADDLRLEIPAHSEPLRFKVAIASGGRQNAPEAFRNYLAGAGAPENLRTLCKGGKAQWTREIVTKGAVGSDEAPYVVDTITEPVENPYNIKTFFGGFDFFEDGRAAICTFHGDVFVVSGIDEKMDKLTWKRYATGLFQPLGVKIVDHKVYVLGRDQITRLHDLNEDGEADFYENFNNDSIVTPNYHEFSLDLHTDREGNFYYVKGAPWEPEVTSPHQGCMIKVAGDGSKMEVFATGFRAPNGMTVGPRDEITVSDNQGHWIPSSKLNWINEGGFYGMTPAAHRALKLSRGGTNFTANPSDPKDRAEHKFKGWEVDSPQPEGYDQPLAWLPMNMDNSSGGQLWVTSDKWGPLSGKLLFMSYGKCTLFEVMLDERSPTAQGAMIQLPLKFNSGIMRGRVNPRDGQVYLCGLRGWQSSATRDGGFYRVRYTGKPVYLPTSFRATEQGIHIGFTCKLDPELAADPDSYNLRRWNYKWTGAYGSPEFTVKNPDQKGQDQLEIKSAKLSNNGTSVLLEIADMKSADQVKVSYSLDSEDGTEMTHDIYATVHNLGASELSGR